MKLSNVTALCAADPVAANQITAEQIESLLQNVSVTFATVMYVTKVATAAAHKAESIRKVTVANVILASSLKAHTSVYANKVKKTATINSAADAQAVEDFVPASNWFEHTACHSIVQHKNDNTRKYLYAIFNNNSKSLYVHNEQIVDKQHVAQFLTPSAVKELMKEDSTVVNKTHGIAHQAIVRVVELSNIVSIKARKQIIVK